MLITPPPGLLGDPFNLYKQDGEKAVDAIVVHPPLRTDGPDQRPSFLHAPDRQKIRGRLAGGPRPALVTARAHNASHDSIPLDQVILREGREWFELWVPKVEVTLHAYSLQGQLTVDQDAEDSVLILTPHAK